MLRSRCSLSLAPALVSVCLASIATAEDARDPRAGEYRKSAVESTGDPARGKKIFEGDKAKCARCHGVGVTKRMAGPDLLGIADKYDRAQIVRHVLEPSAEILAGYATLVVITNQGEAVTGIIQKRSDDTVELFVEEGKVRRIKLKNVAKEQNGKASLMAAGLHEQLTKDEFADLIEYLTTLKNPAAYQKAGPGTPQKIDAIDEPIRLEAFHPKSIRFQHPVDFAVIPGTSGRYLVVENDPAKVWLLEESESGMTKSLFLDMKPEAHTGQHMGLMGLAFHPNFEENRKYYLDHHFKIDGKFGSFVVERRTTPDGRRDAAVPSRRILRIDQGTIFHTGGMIAFGPDGYLYIGTGDGGPQTDPEGHAQNLSLLLGKVLRIDIDRRDPGLEYAIPRTNPFHGHPDAKVRQEIWAYGLRQAWRFSWDPLTKDLWVGDVGQVRFEEITIVRGGENHGWNVFEGFLPFSDRFRKAGLSFVPPVVALHRRHGVSVTGGHVYRGSRSPSFQGVYVFCDYESKDIWGLTQKNRELVKIRRIGKAPDRIGSFTVDPEGEIFAVGYDTGTIYRVVLDDASFE